MNDELPKTTQQLLREYAEVTVFTRETFSNVRTLMRNAADHIAELERDYKEVVGEKAEIAKAYLAISKAPEGER